MKAVSPCGKALAARNRLHSHGEHILRPLRLNDAEIDDLVAFLESLSPSEPPSLPPAVATCLPAKR